MRICDVQFQVGRRYRPFRKFGIVMLVLIMEIKGMSLAQRLARDLPYSHRVIAYQNHRLLRFRMMSSLAPALPGHALDVRLSGFVVQSAFTKAELATDYGEL